MAKPKMTKGPSPVCAVRLPAVMRAELDAYCKRHGKTRAAVIQKAICREIGRLRLMQTVRAAGGQPRGDD